MSLFGFGGFKVEKIKPALKMSIQRIQLLKNKKTVSISKSKKQVAQLLKDGKEEKARITTEHIVREDFMIEAYDILELLAELVLERIRLIDSEKQCPFDMREAVMTLIYAANRTEVKELTNVKEQLIKKYGKEFGEHAMSNRNGCVNERIVHKLSAQPPNAFLVLNYMKELAAEYDIDWQPDETTEKVGTRFDTAMAAPTGQSVDAGMGSGLGADAYRVTDGRILPPGSTLDIPAAPGSEPGQSNRGGNRPGGAGAGGGGGGFSAGDASGSAGVGGPAGGSLSGNGAAARNGSIPYADVVDPSSQGGSGGFDDAFDVPAAPTGTPTPRSGDGYDGGSGGNDFVDDLTTHGTDDAAVPDYDELAARFESLKKR